MYFQWLSTVAFKKIEHGKYTTVMDFGMKKNILHLTDFINIQTRTKEVSFRGENMFERTARVIHSLRRNFKLEDILSYTGFSKAIYVLAEAIG